MNTKSTVRNDLLAGDGCDARCNSFWRTFRCGIATLLLSDPEPDSKGEGAFRLAMPRDWPVKHNKRLQVKLPCMNRVVLFAVNEMLQGPEQSRGNRREAR